MPVIKPWIFYVISVVSNLYDACGLVALIVGFGLLFFGCSWLFDVVVEENKKPFPNVLKKLLIVFAISMGGVVVIPSETTMYKMLVAQYVTYENVDKATENINEGVDYIFNKLNKEDKKDE